jgi:hypothetical protein
LATFQRARFVPFAATRRYAMIEWPTQAARNPDCAAACETPQVLGVSAVMIAEGEAVAEVYMTEVNPEAPEGAAGSVMAPPVLFAQVPVVVAAPQEAEAV